MILSLKRLLAVLLFSHLAISGTAAAGDTIPLRVMTYNIWGMPVPFAHAQWRYAEIPKRLNDMDVVAFEEAWSDDTDVVWKGNKTHPYVAFGGNPHGILTGGSGLILISKYPIVESRFKAYSDCSGFECLEHKGVLMARIAIRPDLLVDFYCTHLNAWQSNVDVRTSQIMELAEMIYENSFKDGFGNPFILMGDLNSEYQSRNYNDVINDLPVLDSYAEYVSSLSNPTSEQKNGFSYDILKNPWAASKYSGEDHQQRLDYIFYGETIEYSLRVVESHLTMKEAVRDDKPLSDHYAITTLFNLTAPGQRH